MYGIRSLRPSRRPNVSNSSSSAHGLIKAVGPVGLRLLRVNLKRRTCDVIVQTARSAQGSKAFATQPDSAVQGGWIGNSYRDNCLESSKRFDDRFPCGVTRHRGRQVAVKGISRAVHPLFVLSCVPRRKLDLAASDEHALDIRLCFQRVTVCEDQVSRFSLFRPNRSDH